MPVTGTDRDKPRRIANLMYEEGEWGGWQSLHVEYIAERTGLGLDEVIDIVESWAEDGMVERAGHRRYRMGLDSWWARYRGIMALRAQGRLDE